ncbi:ATP-binding cassette domain-containing protein [Leucobacter musarum]|uniref:ATP-binding cassette domain-containing protein n=1 Tax=Leucobacter musarum TaxID=1930747 RepID=UPI00094980BC|nr:ATP-binding cassette domain-containing protein [Leucobacter musarum]
MPISDQIIAEQVHVSIDGRPILNDITVRIARGAVTVIMGPNGAGKSTLLEVLAGVRPATRGTITRAGSVALVVQRIAAPDALPITVGEVVAMGTWGRGRTGGRDRRTRVAAALDRVALADLVDRPFSALSGGQRQRALLAQGIAGGADIFCLDEPATGLDTASRERTQRLLEAEAARGAAVVCVTHDPDAIASADVVLRLESGCLVETRSASAMAVPPRLEHTLG